VVRLDAPDTYDPKSSIFAGVNGGDFATSFALKAAGETHTPRSIEATLQFSVPDGASIDWLRYNPNLFFASVFFDKP
jgi:hypothetical protein